MIQTDQIHKFEQAGLGAAPFRLVGYERKVFQPSPGDPIKPGGTCDYCSTGIMHMFYIKSSDGRTFHVGSDCVMKTGDAGLVSKVEREVKNIKKLATQEKQDAKIAEGIAQLDNARETLMGKAHPNGWEGKTLLDYVEWMLKNAGRSGKVSAAKIILKHA